jgi:hypothetical protein
MCKQDFTVCDPPTQHLPLLYSAIFDVKIFRAPRSSVTRLSSTFVDTLIPYSEVDINFS